MRSDIRSVWDLTLDEIEEIHSKRHMNNYVHAGLLVPALSAWPTKPCRVRPSLCQPSLEEAANKILASIPDLVSGRNPSGTRIRVTRDLFGLYRSLPDLGPDQVPDVMRLFASLAFAALKAERNDNMPLWIPPPIRQSFPEHERTFPLMLQPFAMEDILPAWRDIFERTKIDIENRATIIFPLVMRSVQAILVMVENGTDHELAFKAFANLEKAMLDYEHRHSLPKQIRYRGTLYLYGGNLLQRMGRFEEARTWYLMDIDDPNLPNRFRGNGYLIPLKLCERLISAHEVTPDGPERLRLTQLTNATLAAVLTMARSFARDLLSELDRHPEADLRPAWIELGSQRRLFGGEGCREPLLAALLYQKMVRGIPYADTDYSLLEPLAA